MTVPEAEILIDPDTLPPVEPPPIPSVPTGGYKRVATLQQYAQRIVQRLGAPAALLLAAEIDEATADELEDDR
jgi:hypothetical protein